MVLLSRVEPTQRANINTVGGEYGTALAAAVFCKSTDNIMLLLLDRGADISMVGGCRSIWMGRAHRIAATNSPAGDAKGGKGVFPGIERLT